MRAIVHDAIESARSASCGKVRHAGAPPERRLAFETVRNAVLAVVTELHDDMTLDELRDELSHASNQYRESDRP